MVLLAKNNMKNKLLNKKGSTLIEVLLIVPIFFSLSIAIFSSIYLICIKVLHEHIHYEFLICLHQYENKNICKNWFEKKSNQIPFGKLQLSHFSNKYNHAEAETNFFLNINNFKNIGNLQWRLNYGMENPKSKQKRWPLTIKDL